jgi:acetyl-CoA carboxylase biotin carboxyl carrier protein
MAIKDTADSMETPANPAQTPIDTKLVRRLADILKDTGLSEIEVEQGELRIRVARELTVQAAPQVYAAAPAPAPTVAAPAPTSAPAAPAPAASTPAAPAERKGELVKSPMVGTIYLQATPGQPPFVKPGDKVTEGQTLMIVEAMKTMNPIPAPRAGVVVEILVEDSQPVEYGAPLVVLE